MQDIRVWVTGFRLPEGEPRFTIHCLMPKEVSPEPAHPPVLVIRHAVMRRIC